MNEYLGRYRYACEPAATVIRALGGVRRMAKAIGVSPELVSQWNRPPEQQGTGGWIPPQHHNAILRASRATIAGGIVDKALLESGERRKLDVPSASKIKGDRFERQVVDDLIKVDLDARRVPLSGAAAGYPGDVEIRIGEKKWLLQCKYTKKHSAGGRQSVARLLGQVTVARVMIGTKPLIAMRRGVFVDLLNGKVPAVANMPVLRVPGRMILQHLEGHDALVFRRNNTTEWLAIVGEDKWAGPTTTKSTPSPSDGCAG